MNTTTTRIRAVLTAATVGLAVSGLLTVPALAGVVQVHHRGNPTPVADVVGVHVSQAPSVELLPHVQPDPIAPPASAVRAEQAASATRKPVKTTVKHSATAEHTTVQRPALAGAGGDWGETPCALQTHDMTPSCKKWVDDQVEFNSCLEHGGKWNVDRQRCDYPKKTPKPDSSPGPEPTPVSHPCDGGKFWDPSLGKCVAEHGAYDPDPPRTRDDPSKGDPPAASYDDLPDDAPDADSED